MCFPDIKKKGTIIEIIHSTDFLTCEKNKTMKRIFTLLILTLFLSGMVISCSGPEQSKGLTKEQRDRIDKDKKEFEKKLQDDDDDGR